ncbi:metallophosphoesterase family protein [Arthrobacter sp. MAHUQ-56]
MSALRFAVAGDWHGDLSIARAVVRTLKCEDVHLLLHVGDLAVRWPGPKKGRFDKRLGQLLDDADVELLFIDGNHDNHKELRELEPLPDGTQRLSGQMSYVPRGTVIERHGVRIGGLGGAYSVDRRWRTEGKDLWSDLEEPTPEEAERLIASAPVDVLLTHDAPAKINGLKGLALPPEIASAAGRTRELLQSAVDALKPALVFSGHWHQRKSHELDWGDGTITAMHVLAHEGSWGGNTVLVHWAGNGSPGVMPLRIRS